MEHLCDAFQLGKTLSELINKIYGHAQNTRETVDAFSDDFQALARKIIVHKPYF